MVHVCTYPPNIIITLLRYILTVLSRLESSSSVVNLVAHADMRVYSDLQFYFRMSSKRMRTSDAINVYI